MQICAGSAHSNQFDKQASVTGKFRGASETSWFSL
jgi:hypothetical protein